MELVDRTVVVKEVVEALPRGAAWASAVRALAHEIDAGRIYNRDVNDLVAAVSELEQALLRRQRRGP